MTGSREDQDRWVRETLGVDLGVKPAEPGAVCAYAASIAQFRDALERVEAEIGKLQSVLRNSDDAELMEIAEYGLSGITGGHKSKLVAAVLDVERDDTPLKAAKAANLAQQFRAYLMSDPRVGACDDNPFGIQVSIRATLGGALGGMETALAAGAHASA